MKNLILATLLAFSVSGIATAEMKMQNSNPSAEPKAEPILGHHMQNSDPMPAAEAAPEPEHTMKNTNPKKFVSSNAGTLEEKHSGK
ncbi:hypothetical protein [Methyloglobulus sp.]|uniref:hypothetical protein n=1 Tax=Methyloglobulus sp. TaxID=2518622 RepID=UPI0032B726EC